MISFPKSVASLNPSWRRSKSTGLRDKRGRSRSSDGGSLMAGNRGCGRQCLGRHDAALMGKEQEVRRARRQLALRRGHRWTREQEVRGAGTARRNRGRATLSFHSGSGHPEGTHGEVAVHAHIRFRQGQALRSVQLDEEMTLFKRVQHDSWHKEVVRRLPGTLTSEGFGRY